MVKIDFEFQTEYGIFRDALHLPDDHGLTEAEIAAMKQQRVDNWVAVVSSVPTEPPVMPEPPATTDEVV